MRKRLWLIGLVVVALLLAACGGGVTPPDSFGVGDAEATVRARVELALVGTAVTLTSPTPTQEPPSTPAPLDSPAEAPSPTEPASPTGSDVPEPTITPVVTENLSGGPDGDPTPATAPWSICEVG